ncbi:MAG: diguanylate cyclase [Thermoplasmataceae archaeon]
MKVAVVETNQIVEGPGEGEKVQIYETEPVPRVVEEYQNPALMATTTRGIWMLKSAMEKGATAIVVAEAGSPAFNFTQGKAVLYSGAGMRVDTAIKALVDGKLPKMDRATHEHGHGRENHRH